MISVGGRLNTDFKLKVVRAGEVTEVAFRELLPRRTIVSVYMKNNTGSCDRQNESLANVAATLAKRGYDLIAISRDTCGSHRKYAEKLGLAYTLASDPEDRFARAADAIVEKSMYGRTFLGPARAAYVLAPDGIVLAVVPKVDPKNHAEQLLAAIDGLDGK